MIPTQPHVRGSTTIAFARGSCSRATSGGEQEARCLRYNEARKSVPSVPCSVARARHPPCAPVCLFWVPICYQTNSADPGCVHPSKCFDSAKRTQSFHRLYPPMTHRSSAVATTAEPKRWPSHAVQPVCWANGARAVVHMFTKAYAQTDHAAVRPVRPTVVDLSFTTCPRSFFERTRISALNVPATPSWTCYVVRVPCSVMSARSGALPLGSPSRGSGDPRNSVTANERHAL